MLTIPYLDHVFLCLQKNNTLKCIDRLSFAAQNLDVALPLRNYTNHGKTLF